MLEQIYYKKFDLGDEENLTMDITKISAIDKKYFLAGEEYLVSGLSI